uniref:Uncharacterized protein n=1 Tax=Dulem virus 136 TaxID=3145613 RepID=A0AAU8AV67_9VIRU
MEFLFGVLGPVVSIVFLVALVWFLTIDLRLKLWMIKALKIYVREHHYGYPLEDYHDEQ